LPAEWAFEVWNEPNLEYVWSGDADDYLRLCETAAAAARSAAGRVDALSWWVASDHFEELGRPTSLLHGGVGLLTVGNLRKPRLWALKLLERLGPEELRVDLKRSNEERPMPARRHLAVLEAGA
jgi:beta-xylosidase